MKQRAALVKRTIRRRKPAGQTRPYAVRRRRQHGLNRAEQVIGRPALRHHVARKTLHALRKIGVRPIRRWRRRTCRRMGLNHQRLRHRKAGAAVKAGEPYLLFLARWRRQRSPPEPSFPPFEGRLRRIHRHFPGPCAPLPAAVRVCVAPRTGCRLRARKAAPGTLGDILALQQAGTEAREKGHEFGLRAAAFVLFHAFGKQFHWT